MRKHREAVVMCMKKIQIPTPRKVMSFSEKFGRGVTKFGTGVKPAPTEFGHIPLILLIMLGVVVLCVSLMLLGRLWKVKSVTAADGQLYSATVLVDQSGVKAGDGFLSFDAGDVAKRLKKELPLLEKVKVRKSLSGKVTITVTEQTDLYYTCHNQNYYIISQKTHKVLSVHADPTEARRVGAIYLGLPEATRVRVGDELSFVNLPYAPDSLPPEYTTYEVETGEPEEEYAYVFEFVKAMEATSMGTHITGMELGDRYDIWVVLDHMIKIRVGSMDELDRKLDLADRSLNDKAQNGGLPQDMPTLVDVSDPARIIHRTSPDIELPDWAA